MSDHEPYFDLDSDPDADVEEVVVPRDDKSPAPQLGEKDNNNSNNELRKNAKKNLDELLTMLVRPKIEEDEDSKVRIDVFRKNIKAMEKRGKEKQQALF